MSIFLLLPWCDPQVYLGLKPSGTHVQSKRCQLALTAFAFSVNAFYFVLMKMRKARLLAAGLGTHTSILI